MERVDIDLMGRFGVRRDGVTIEDAEFGGRRVRQLIRILATERGRVVSRDTLIEALWGEHPPADPATNLNVVVSRARRALSDPGLIETAAAGYLLRGGPGVQVDVERFETNVDRAREAYARGDTSRAWVLARAALDIWDEPFPEDAYADWARAPRDRLERLHQEVLEVASAAALSNSRAREAVDLATAAVARQPLREAARLLLIRALVAEGDQAAAVAAYLDLRRMLADELGIDPSPEASTLYEQLLHGTLSGPAAGTRAHPRGADLPPLVGRGRELAQLASLGPENRVAVVSGRSGWGKSRLLDDVRARSQRPVLLARALLPEREEPWSLARTLLQSAPAAAADLSQILGSATLTALQDVMPDIASVGSERRAVDPQSRRALAQQGLVRVIAATAPSLVLVDDLQWADSSSLDVLSLLVARTDDIALVLAYRPEEVAEDTPVARFLTGIAHARPLEVALAPLDEEAVHHIVGSRSMASALTTSTDGTPFAVLQVLRSLEREGLLRRSSAGGWEVVTEPAPDRVRELARAGQRDAVWRQFERQPREAREMLASLALLGRPVPVRLLSRVLGAAPDDAMRTLRELARNHLVRHDAEGFRVDHDLVGETIRDRLDPVVRAQVHQRIADALVDGDGPVEELARHLTGAGDASAAASAYASAAAARLECFADREAHQLAAEGLTLDPAPDVRRALLEVRAETHARSADLDAARRDLRAALAQTHHRPTRSRLLTRLAELTAGAEDILRGSELADLALAEAGDDPRARARALFVRALIDRNQIHQELAERRFDEALEIFTRIGDAAGIADILDARAMTTFGFGDITNGIAAFDRVARLFNDSGNLLRVVTPRSTRGHGLLFAGRQREALEETGAALELARTLGYAEGEAMVLWHHTEALVGGGRPDEGLVTADLGVALARRLGHRGWTAMTVCARGVAHAALGDLAAAARDFEETLRVSEHLAMFRSWAHSRLAQVLLTQGDLEAAGAHVDEALAPGPGLQLYEARLAHCELAVRRGDEDARILIVDALRRAEEGGHLLSAERLRDLHTTVAAR